MIALYIIVQIVEKSKDSWPPKGSTQRSVLDFLGTLAIVVLNLLVRAWEKERRRGRDDGDPGGSLICL